MSSRHASGALVRGVGILFEEDILIDPEQAEIGFLGVVPGVDRKALDLLRRFGRQGVDLSFDIVEPLIQTLF